MSTAASRKSRKPKPPARHVASRRRASSTDAQASGTVSTHTISRTWLLATCAALVILNLFVYAQVRQHEFIGFDDPLYVSQNDTVLAGLTWEGVTWAFSAGHAGNWHPVTWLSHMLDAELFGANPSGHHLTNVLLHILNSILVFLFLAWTTGAPGRSAVVAGLFAAHPLHVESVAWISERKDVLSTLFWLMTMLAYVRYAKAPSLRRYGAVVGLFALGLMAKPMLVTLPCVLLLLDVWPLGRLRLGWRTLVVEKIPLFALTAATSVVTVIVQRQAGAVQSLEALSLTRRATNAVVSYAAYLGQMVWPRDLAALYPFPDAVPAWQVIGAVFLLGGLSVYAVRLLVSRPYVPVGWFWYLGTLVPVIGLVQAGSQPMADRFTYIPYLGVFVMIVWLVADVAGRWVSARVLLAGAGVVIAGLAVGARAQGAYWKDSIAVWERTLAVTRNNYRAHSAYGFALKEAGRVDEAVTQYQTALSLNPNYGEAHVNLGIVRMERDDLATAIDHFQQALRISPTYPEAQTNLGLALAESGRPDEAIPYLRQAMAQRPDNPVVRNAMGFVLAAQGDLTAAAAELTTAVRLRPGSADAHANLGLVLLDLGRIDDALASLSTAVRLDPGDARAHHGLAVIRAGSGQPVEAEAHYRESIRLDPSYGEAYNGLARLLLDVGRVEEAATAFADAARVQPGEPDFHFDLGVVLARLDRVPEAIRAFDRVLELSPANEAAARARAALIRN